MEKTQFHKKQNLLFILILLSLAFFVMVSFLFFFSKSINASQSALGTERLREVSMQKAAFLKATLNERTRFVNSVATHFSATEDLRSEEVVVQLSRFAEGSQFQRLAIDFLDGTSHTNDGHRVDISDLGYLDKIGLGQVFLTDLIYAKVDGTPCISIISPIFQNGMVVAAVRGTMYAQNFSSILQMNFFDGEGYFHLISSDGEYLATSKNQNAFLMDENYFDAIDRLDFDEGFSAQKLRDDIQNNRAGMTSYSFEGMDRYAEYVPVESPNWYLLVMAPKWVIDQNAVIIQRQVLFLIAQVSAISLVVFFLILFMMKRSRDEISRVNKQLSLGEKRYRFMLERSNNIIFEYFLQDGKIVYSDKFETLFGYAPITLGLPFSLLQSDHIHPEDHYVLLRLFHNVELGVPNDSVELRIKNSANEYLWCLITIVSIFNESNLPIQALGVIENVDNQKKREHELINKAERDLLTGVYNKITTEQLIKDFLQNQVIFQGMPAQASQHALMIIDVDDFKLINDKLGHLYGDIVLAKLTNSLKPILKSSDIIGRLGGDEFFIFLKYLPSEEAALHMADKICSLFHKTYSENQVSCSISASIGIAHYPTHGEDFETLYRNADLALYRAKANGKNQAVLFDGSISASDYISNRTEIVSASFLAQKSFQENRVEYIFKMLYDTADPLQAIHNTLRIFADYFNFTCSYIFEMNQDGTSLTNTFCWHTEQDPSFPASSPKIPISRFQTILAAVNATNIFIMTALDQLPPDEQSIFSSFPVRSLSLFGIWEQSKLIGLIGFGDSAAGRLLTNCELDEIVTVCNLLVTFLLKQRSFESAQNSLFTLSEIMNNLAYFAYVIDPSTYEVLFVNKKILAVVPTAELGAPCFQTFMHRTTPCDICPLMGLPPDEGRHSVEINNDLYHIYSKTTACWINWTDGKRACLLSSLDISEYR